MKPQQNKHGRLASIAGSKPVLAVGALVAWLPWTLDWLEDGTASGHMQSIILGAVLASSSVQMFALGVSADQISSLRAIGIRTLRETREMHYGTLYADARVRPGDAGMAKRSGHDFDAISTVGAAQSIVIRSSFTRR